MRHRFLFPALLIVVGRMASAETPLEAYAPLKVVGIMPDTRQALLWDAAAAEYRTAKIGDTLEGWRIVDISVREKRVTVAQGEVRDDLVLTRMPRPNALITYGARPVTPDAARPAALPTPVAPTATVAPGPGAPAGNDMLASPGADEGPMDPYAGGEAPVDPYAAAAPAPTGAAAPVVPSQPTVIQDEQPGEPDAAVERHVVRRADLDREINDFDGLMATVRVAPLRGGGFAIVRLEPSSWLAALGFRQGDRVRSIAGEQVSNIDDASRVYARLRSARSFAVEVQRGPRRLVLQYDVR